MSDEAFQRLYPVGSKESKTGRTDNSIFKLFSNGYKTSRDAYIHNFSREACATNARAMIDDCMRAMQMGEVGRLRHMRGESAACQSKTKVSRESGHQSECRQELVGFFRTGRYRVPFPNRMPKGGTGLQSCYTTDPEMPPETALSVNVLREKLEPCAFSPICGFFRDGRCNTGPEDIGLHVVCVVMTEDFLEFSRSRGNDLSTPNPDFDFPGLAPGDRWCLCASRWKEAYEANMAPKVVLAATHEAALAVVPLNDLKRYAVDLV